MIIRLLGVVLVIVAIVSAVIALAPWLVVGGVGFLIYLGNRKAETASAETIPEAEWRPAPPTNKFRDRL